MSPVEQRLVAALKSQLRGYSVKAALPRFANTLCLGAHIGLASVGSDAPFGAEVRFIDWDDRHAAKETLMQTTYEPDIFLVYASRGTCLEIADDIDRAKVQPVAYRIPVTRYLPRYCFIPKGERDRHGIDAFEKLMQVMDGCECFVYTDHHSLAQALFGKDRTTIRWLSGVRWLEPSRLQSVLAAAGSPELNAFFMSAPATAAMERQQDVLSSIELPAKSPLIDTDEFKTELLVVLGKRAQLDANRLKGFFLDYHTELFGAAADADALTTTAQIVSVALAPRYPEFAYQSCTNRDSFGSCLAQHHGGRS